MIRFIKTRPVKSPSKGSAYSVGVDFFVPDDFQETELKPGEDILIPSGIKAEIPIGYGLLAVDKSGIALSDEAKRKAGMSPKTNSIPSCCLVGSKLVDPDYKGEIHLSIINVGKVSVKILPGMKLVQFIVKPSIPEVFVEVNENELNYPDSARSGGFSSTGL